MGFYLNQLICELQNTLQPALLFGILCLIFTILVLVMVIMFKRK